MKFLPPGLTKNALYDEVLYKKWLEKAFKAPNSDLESRIRAEVREEMKMENAQYVRKNMSNVDPSQEEAFDSYDDEDDYSDKKSDDEIGDDQLHKYFEKLTKKRLNQARKSMRRENLRNQMWNGDNEYLD